MADAQSLRSGAAISYGHKEGVMLDDAVMEGWCPCPMCRLARRRGIRGDMHRYDDIHAEDVSWSFKVFCRCCRCREVRRTLAQRVIRA